MPAPSKNGTPLFLGIELATDQLRASIVDESLDLVGVECVDFDQELPEYQTQGGIFTTPGDAYTTPVDMWVKALDFLFEKLGRNYDVTRIKCIGGCAQHAFVWWKASPIAPFPALDPRLPLHSQLPPNTFSLANTPVAQDTSAHTHGFALEALLGGADMMASRVGTCANASMLAAHLLRVREAWTGDVWARTGRVQLASAFLASLVVGRWVNMNEAEAMATGIWVHGGAPGANGQGHWDEGVLDIIGGNREDAKKVRSWLGEVDPSGTRKVYNVSKYLCDRYGFEPETLVTPFTADYLSAYISLCPSPADAVLSFGPMDMLLTPAQNYTPTRLYTLFPHPVQDANEKRRYIAALTNRNADVPRALVRDMYTKSWSAFDRLVAIVPPGGSIGLDDKLFSFWLLQGDSHPLSQVKGIFRFETGIKVNEFRDLRANPRCLLESQVMSFRVRWSRMISTGVLGANFNRNRGNNVAQSAVPSPSPLHQRNNPSAPPSHGLSFDPYDYTPLPARMLVTGAAANFPSVANLVGDVFNAPVFMPSTQVDSAQVVPHRNAPAGGFPSRATLGGAYVARWLWGKERHTGGRGLGGFEEEIRRLLGKRWVASSATPLRTNTNAPAGGHAHGAPGSGANSGASTPFGHRPGFGTTITVEEEEEEEEGPLGQVGVLGGGYGVGGSNGGMLHHSSVFAGGFADRDLGRDVGRMRSLTASTADTILSSGTSGGAPSTAFTTPDMNSGGTSGATSPGGKGGAGAGANSANGGGSGTTALTPVSALPTADSEAQMGLAKVAEADLDAFMTYAAIVPEYCRLENMLCKNLV